MMVVKRISYLVVLSVIGGALILNGGAGCTLQREGACGEGEIVCSLTKKDYKFTTKANSYRFEGACEIVNEGSAGSTLGGPSSRFKVLGTWDRQTLKFAEAVEISGDYNTEMAIIGSSAVDPWLNPYHPVGISARTGDPQAFASNLCLQQIPPEYSHIPFSRNVILHVLSAADLANLYSKASTPEEHTPPPAPPCPSAWLTGPPKMDMPKPGLVYKENVKGVTVYLTSRCGSKNVDYTGSEYHVFFERAGSNGWEKFRGYKMKMTYYHQGGSLGSETLPLDKPGKWRVHARHLTKSLYKGTVKVGDYGDWVEFWVGDPKTQIAAIDTSKIKVLSANTSPYREMKQAWDVSSSKQIVSTASKPTLAEDDKVGLSRFKTQPRAHKVNKNRPLLAIEAAVLTVSDFELGNSPQVGDFIDLEISLHNKGTKSIAAGDVTFALNCAKKPGPESCAYRLDSFLVPRIDAGETWQHELKKAIQVNGFGGYTVTASTFGPTAKPSVKSLSFNVRAKATIAPKRKELHLKNQERSKRLKPGGGKSMLRLQPKE